MSGPGDCCAVMGIALERQHPSIGLVTGTRVNFKTGDMDDAIAVKFRKAKKGDASYETRFDDGTSAARATFAFVEFCPFCGAKGCLPAPPSPSTDTGGGEPAP